jgi:hypothetical protein
MTNEDFDQLRRLGRHLGEIPSVGLLSPHRTRSLKRFWRREPIGEQLVFPDATTLPRRRWDLNEPSGRRFDLLVASNVFMYSPDPPRWFTHVFAACSYFLMLDLVRRQRSQDSEFGPDGDCMRYAVGEARPRVDRQFDLGLLGDKLLGYRPYYGGANAFDEDPLHVVALLRGDLTPDGPDVHPAGIRSVLSELSSSPGAPADGAG